MTDYSGVPIAVALSRSIDEEAYFETPEAEDSSIAALLHSDLNATAFSDAVSHETDLLLAMGHRLDDSTRTLMLSAARSAMLDVRRDSGRGDQTLVDLVDALNAIPDVDDEVMSLQGAATDTVSQVKQRREAADELARLLDGVATGKLRHDDVDLTAIAAVIQDLDISAELACDGIEVAVAHAEGMTRRGSGRLVYMKGIRPDKLNVGQGEWAEWLDALRRKLNVAK